MHTYYNMYIYYQSQRLCDRRYHVSVHGKQRRKKKDELKNNPY